MARITTVAGFTDLTSAETLLIAACKAGEPCELEDGTRPTGESDARSIRADLLAVLITGGSADCGLGDDGVLLRGAWIIGPLNLEFANVPARIELHDCYFTDHLNLYQARLRQLNLQRSHFPGLFAQGMVVAGSMFLIGINATGTVDLSGARIDRQLDCDGAVLESKEGKALNAQSIHTGEGMFLCGLVATGTVDVNSAKIGGQLAFHRARLDGKGSTALLAQGATIGDNLFLRNFTATGTVNLVGAQIGGQFDCSEATFDGNGGKSLYAQNLRTMTALIWRNVTIKQGRVDFTAAHVDNLVDDLQSWPTGADQLDLGGFTYNRITAAPTDAKSRLGWLKNGAMLKGTFYPQPYTQLARVLSEMGHDRDARKVLEERSRILGIASRARRPEGWQRRHYLNPACYVAFGASWLFDRLSQLVVGYGHAPHRALYSLTFLFLIATTLAHLAWKEGSFAPNSDVIITSTNWTNLMSVDCIGDLLEDYGEPCIKNPADYWSSKDAPGMDWDTFNPFGYGLDLVVPILTLGQTDAWAPSKDRGPMGKLLWWGRWVLISFGWIVSALGAAAITGIIQRK